MEDDTSGPVGTTHDTQALPESRRPLGGPGPLRQITRVGVALLRLSALREVSGATAMEKAAQC